MADPLYLVPKGSRILVTGANGFVGSNVVDYLLELGFRVRGTIRAPKPWLDKMYQDKYGQDSYESVILTSFEDVDALSDLMKDVSGVAHVATDVSFSSNMNEVIPWVVRAVQNLLEAASRHSDIKRVVMTSSAIAALFPVPNKEGIVVHEDTWNDEAVKAAWNPNSPEHLKGFFGYAASKTEAEKAAWKWVKEHNPSFHLNTVLPEFTTGRILHKEIGGSTMAWVRGLAEGNRQIFQTFVPQYFSDVIDIARLHAAALLDPNTVSQRLFGFAAPVNLTDMISIVRKLRPESTVIPDPPVDEESDLSVILPAKDAEKILKEFCGRDGWTSLEDSIAQGFERL